MQSIVDLHKYNYNFLKVSDFPTLIFLQNSKQLVITNGYSISEGKSAIDHVDNGLLWLLQFKEEKNHFTAALFEHSFFSFFPLQNSNVLQAVLCLLKELDKDSLDIVGAAVKARAGALD